MGLALVLQLAPGPSSLAAAGVFTVFLIAATKSYLKGKRMDCHCFGALSQESLTVWTLTRVAAFVGISLTAATLGLLNLGAGGAVLFGASSPDEVLAAAVTASVATMIMLVLSQLHITRSKLSSAEMSTT